MARYTRVKALPIQADKGIYVGTTPTQIADANGILAGAVASSQLAPLVLQTTQVSLTAAQINGMYATPVVVVPAIANKYIYVASVNFDLTGTATQFANGGVVNVQYAATANGAGTKVHADIAATVVTGATALVHSFRIPLVLSAVADATLKGIGLYISNQTGAFDTGTGTAVVTVRYYVI
ncbi:MAG: hypothetical protein NTW30_05610 [Candidatus Aenigmarchaeota archaeon]|nr:hypothetical protein [Candidatus Aenigmarchaeota archaeon]